jgi:hypothetical protein
MFLLMVTSCLPEKGEFVITDVSKKHLFTDSAPFLATCCVSTYVSGHLDAPAWILVEYYSEGGLIDSIFLPKGVVDIQNSHGDFYYQKRINVKYFPGEAKKGNLRITTRIY